MLNPDSKRTLRTVIMWACASFGFQCVGMSAALAIQSNDRGFALLAAGIAFLFIAAKLTEN